MSASDRTVKAVNSVMIVVENGWGRAEELRSERRKVSRAKIWRKNFQTERMTSAKDSKKD